MLRIRVRHRARTNLLGKWLKLNWSNGRPTSVSARLGPFTWNSRKKRAARINLPGGLYGEVSANRRDRSR